MKITGITKEINLNMTVDELNSIYDAILYAESQDSVNTAYSRFSGLRLALEQGINCSFPNEKILKFPEEF